MRQRLEQIKGIDFFGHPLRGRAARDEGIAIERVLHGWRAEGVPDRKLLERGMELIEGLYRGLA